MGRHNREVALPARSIRHHGTGQVPQTGSFPEVISGALNTKLVGRLVILLTHQPDRFWLKIVQPENMLAMLITLLTFQLEISWLKELQLWNMLAMLVTLPTFQPDKSELKAEQP